MKSIYVAFIGLFCSMNGMNVCAQMQTVLFPDYDVALGYHDGYNTANMNYQAAIQNAAYVKPATNEGLNGNRSLIHFDLSSIPVGTTISEAKLNLYATGVLGNLDGHQGENASVLQRIVESWSPNTVTWNSQPEATALDQVVLAASSDPYQDYLEIDVTTLIQQMHESDNFGFLFKLIDESATNALLFCSVDHPNGEKHPTLEIKYVGKPTFLPEQTTGKDIISIYPNPNSGLMILEVNKADIGSNFSIIDECGREVARGRVTSENTTVDISGFSSGVYVLQMIDSEKKRVRIVKS